MKKNLLLAFALLLIAVFAMTACNNNNNDVADVNGGDDVAVATPPPAELIVTDDEGEEVVLQAEVTVDLHPALAAALANFPAYTANTNPILPRGTGTDNVLRIGVGSSTVLSGLFLRTHSSDALDTSIASLAHPYLIAWDENNMFTNSGAFSFEVDREANAVIMELQQEVYWHDGVPVTMDDLVFAYEVIAHPDYTGVRFTASSFIPNVVGVEEYREGLVDYISGMVLSNNNRTLRIYYMDPLPPSALFAGGIWVNPIPRHWIGPVIEEVGHEGIEEHPRARHEMLGLGAFEFDTIVPGESVFLTPNDNYWQGTALVDGIYIRLLPFDMVPSAMRAGEFDIAAYQAANLAEFNLMNPTNYQLYGWPAQSVTFLNFRLGYMGEDAEGNPHIQSRDDDHPITNVAIRRAMAYAFDRQTVANVVGQGLWIPAPSVLHPFNAASFMDITRDGFRFDLDHANAILDEAGFTERDADGFRLNLNGEPMTFIYGQHQNPTHEVMVPLNIQNWGLIGLRVEMFEGDFADWNVFTDIVIHGDGVGPIDIMSMGWNLGSNPNPDSLWGPGSMHNVPRYASPTFQQILDDIASEEAWNPEFLADAYARWEQAFHDEVPAIPFTWNLDLVAVNNRVANYSRVRNDNRSGQPGNMGTSTWHNMHLIGLTAPAPY
ncbi:MAG: ABC transporter substrate-binding protein [Defluviitaleaceae bacterium]|nr:ABC transporter substrate-binding protein [Defluviitaleaceae bacterium]